MEMPRRCSSSRRSVSVPVIQRTSVVLPWSTCPAVPMVRAMGRSSNEVPYRLEDRVLVPVEERPHVEPQLPFAHAADHWRVHRTQLLGYRFDRSGTTLKAHGVGGDLVEGQRTAAAPGDRRRYVYREVRCGVRYPLGQVVGLLLHLLRRGVEHLQGRE